MTIQATWIWLLLLLHYDCMVQAKVQLTPEEIEIIGSKHNISSIVVTPAPATTTSNPFQESSTDFEGNTTSSFPQDEEDSDSPPCSDTPARIPNTEMFVKVEGYHVVAFCLPHYKTTFNTSFVDIKCVAGEWRMEDVPHNEVMECVMECMPPCQHGRCALYNNSTACICPPLYSGRSCEVQGCKALPVLQRAMVGWMQLFDDTEAVRPNPMKQEAIGRCWANATFHIPSLDALLHGRPRPNELKFRCENGDWKVKVPWAERYLDFNETHCTYTCVPACQNNATCVKSNEGKTFCQCVPGYTGTHCESKKCQDVTLSGISLSNIETGHSGYTGIVWKDCPTGYIHTSTDKNTYVEKCKDGIWMTTPGQCIPLCESHCLHGGTCVAPNTCACPTGVLGQTCDGDTCVNALTPTINRAIYKNEIHSLTITCETGYRFSSGDHELNFTCVKGKWDFSKQKPYPCVPYCGDIICTNGGTCDGPNLCKCPPQYTGKQCDVERCSELPRYLIHASGSFSSPEMNQYTIRCDAGYELITRNTSLILSCKNGVWQFPQAFHSLFHIACHPVCRPPCFNGGRCVAPNVCRCPEGFTGKICSWRYNKTIQKDMDCKFPFEYKNRWYFSCTTAFHYLPWCATEVTPDGILVTWSICFADMGKMKVIATEGGERCYFPFYHEGHVYHSCTSIGQDRPWCATSVTPSGLVNTTDFCVSALWGAEEVILTVHGNECKSSFRYKEPKPSTFGEESYVKCAIKQVNTQNTLNKEVVLFDLGYQHTTLTKTGKLCMFPFMYDGEQYYTCIQRGHKALWCATNVDTNGTILKDDFCINSYYLDQGVRDLELAPAYVPSFTTKEFYIRSMRLVRALSGNRCVFPFLYQEKAFYACIYRDADVPWCATQVDNDGHVIVRTACPADWDNFYYRYDLSRRIAVRNKIPMSVSGLRCQPFLYKGKLVEGCVKEEGQELWCAVQTTKEKLLAAADFCIDTLNVTETSNQSQHLGDYMTLLINKTTYGLLDPSYTKGTRPLYSVNGYKCIPFIYKDVMHHGCIKEDGKKPWCAIEINPITKKATNQDWCPADWYFWDYFFTLDINSWSPFQSGIHVVRTFTGQHCVFPFLVEGRLYHSCISLGQEEKWCSTLNDAEGHVLEKDFCLPHPKSVHLVRTTQGEMCVPFLHDGVLQTGCVRVEGEAHPYCATKVNNQGLMLVKHSCPDDWNETVIQVPVDIDDSYNDLVMSSPLSESEYCMPFVHNNTIVKHCVDEESKQPWCASAVDGFGAPTAASNCSDEWRENIWPEKSHLLRRNIRATDGNLTIEKKKRCVPFLHDGSVMFRCVKGENGLPWCAVAVDESLNPTQKDICRPDWYIDFLPRDLLTEITTSPSSELLTSSLSPDYFNESPSLLKSPTQPIQFNEIPLMSPLLTTTPHTPTSPPPTSIVSSPSLPPTPTPPSGPQVPSAEWVTGGGNVTVSGKPCIFPFVYKGQEYEQCIQEHAKGPWCPTLLNKHKQPIASEFCKGTSLDSPPTVQLNTTVSGVACVFPFLYRGVRYCHCITLDDNHPWCATQVDSDRHLTSRGYCKGNDTSVKPPRTGNGTSVKPLHVSSQRQFTKDGVECIVPFTYKGIQYWNCSSTERPALWCATLVNAKLQPLQSGYCANNIASIPFQPPPTVIGMAMTIQRGPCIFPFLYRGIVYEQCACVDAPACWCPTSLTRNNEPAVSDYCRGLLQGSPPLISPPAFGLGAPVTVDGWACHFPFRYKGRTYTMCTSEDSNHPWCATIVNDSDQPTESGYCKGSNQPPPSKPPVRVPQPSSGKLYLIGVWV